VLQAYQELATTILLNYHIGRIVLGLMCVGVSVWLAWSGIRVAGFHFLYSQHVSDINISIIRSLRLQPATRIPVQEQYDQCSNSTE